MGSACIDLGDQPEHATVEFHNSSNHDVVAIYVGDAEGFEGGLERQGFAWTIIPPDSTASPRTWATSQQMDLSVRPLCQSGSSWYVLALGPTAREGQALTPEDVTIVEIIEHPCWDDQHATYTIEQN